MRFITMQQTGDAITKDRKLVDTTSPSDIIFKSLEQTGLI
jgi:hypothetical protein